MNGRAQTGFTLVELAVVMIIIGLMIGGILQGKTMITNAKVTKTIEMVTEIDAAMVMFKDRYNILPGDIPLAQVQIPGCTAASFCQNGDGDGAIDDNATPPSTENVGWATDFSDVTVWGENTQTWKHLVLTELLGGKVAAANADPAAGLNWGTTHPEAPMGGGFEILYDPVTAMGIVTHMLRLSPRMIFGEGTGVDRINLYALKPLEAEMMDQKFDDGLPKSGRMFVNYGWDAANDSDPCTVPGNIYDGAVDSVTCGVYFALSF